MSTPGKASKQPFTEAERERARQLRKIGVSYYQIAAELGRAYSVIYYALNPSPKPTKKNTPRDGVSTKKCPACKRSVPTLQGLNFCPFCAQDMRSAYELAARGLLDMLGDITNFYPSEHRDMAVRSLNNAVALLRKADKEMNT